MVKDLHASAFDAGTRVKLDLYRAYLREWLPVFLAKRKPGWKTVNIFDFFAGPGEDSAGVQGSPLIALRELFAYSEQIRSKELTVNLHLNELASVKCEQLKKIVPAYADDLPVRLHITDFDFNVAFERCYPLMDGAANLIFLDQQGIKQVTESVFKRIVSLRATDFLFFVASSYFRRFCEHEAFRQYVHLSREEIKSRDPNDIHRLVLDYYRSLVPKGQSYYLAPFSIRKTPNIFGLIFGSSHWLGIEKFLTNCWKKDPERGEANFDIDGDRIQHDEPFLFEEMNRSKKLEVFECELSEQVRSGKLRTDRQVFLYALSRGFLPRHARDVIDRLDNAGEISKKGLSISRTCMKKGREPGRINRTTKAAESGEIP